MTELLYKDEVYAIVGPAMEVHRTLGCGFLEAVYQEALEMELTERGIPYIAPKELTICYKGRTPNMKVGVLINFGSESLEWKRKVLTR